MMGKSKIGCHTGNPLVFEAQGIKVYAGGTSRQGTWVKMKPYPDVAIGPIDVMRLKVSRDVLPDGWTCTEKVTVEKMPHIIGIDWPDYGIPSNLGKEFWLALIDDFKKNDVKSVSTSCMGGHGRTGVQLCILAHLLIPEKDRTWSDVAQLINYIRDTYCDHAVEGINQQEYIADMTDLPVGDSLFIQTKQNIQWVDDDMHNIWDDIQKENKKKKPKKKARKAIDGAKFDKSKKKNQANLERYTKSAKGALHRGYTLIELVDTGQGETRFLWIPNKWMKGQSQDAIAEMFGEYNTVSNLDYDKDAHCVDCNKEYHPMEMHHNTCKYCLASECMLEVDYENKKIGGTHAAFLDVTIDSTDGFVEMRKLIDTNYFAELEIQLFTTIDERTGDWAYDNRGMRVKEMKRNGTRNDE